MTLPESYGESIIQYDSPDNIVDLIENTLEKFADRKVFGTKDDNGTYQWITYEHFGTRIKNLTGGLAKIGVSKGDKVGIISTNRVEWAVGFFATESLGATWVPMYEKELFSVWKYIVKDAEISILLVANEEIYDKVKGFMNEIPTLKDIFVIDGNGENTMQALEKLGSENPIESYHPNQKEIAVVIYTSGTTGEPKGVLLSHGNLTSNAQAGWHLFPDLNQDSVSLSHLPWAHSYALTAELNNFMQFGGSIAFWGSLETMAEDLVKANPTHLMSVPRVFNKVYDGIHRKMAEEGGIKQKLFNAAVSEAKKCRESNKRTLKLKVLDKLVFSKIRARFGNQFKTALTASAKTEPEIAQFFFDVGIPVLDAYGLTETSPALTMNTHSEHKLGTVGKPVEKTKIVIDRSRVGDDSRDGEIIAFGPQIMQGYLNKPEQTAKVMTPDGGFRTGDRGFLDEDGFLSITGRFKEEYKLQNGKYVFPAQIEEYIKLIPWIADAMLYGEGKPYNICLVVPDYDVLEHHAQSLDLSLPSKELIRLEQIQVLISKEIQNQLKKRIGSYEIPKKFIFLDEAFTVDNKMLTQTFKLKRRNVLAKYGELIEKLYTGEEEFLNEI